MRLNGGSLAEVRIRTERRSRGHSHDQGQRSPSPSYPKDHTVEFTISHNKVLKYLSEPIEGVHPRVRRSDEADRRVEQADDGQVVQHIGKGGCNRGAEETSRYFVFDVAKSRHLQLNVGSVLWHEQRLVPRAVARLRA